MNKPTVQEFEKALNDADEAIIQAREPQRPRLEIELAHPTLDIEALVLTAWLHKIMQENKQDFRPVITAHDARLLNIAMDAVLRRLPR